MGRHNNGHDLMRSFMPPQAQPQQTALVAAPAINDIQLVALVAANFGGNSPADAVLMAQEIIAEAVVGQERFLALVKAKREAAAKAAEAE